MLAPTEAQGLIIGPLGVLLGAVRGRRYEWLILGLPETQARLPLGWSQTWQLDLRHRVNNIIQYDSNYLATDLLANMWCLEEAPLPQKVEARLKGLLVKGIFS